MKILFLSFSLALCLAASTSAQPILPVTTTLQANQVKAFVSSNGQLFNDGSAGQFIPIQPGLAEKSLLRGSGIWVAGIDPGGNLKGAFSMNNTTSFQPGSVDPDNNSLIDLNNIWRVSCASINQHRADFADNGVIDNPNSQVYGYPAKGNPFFSQYNNQQQLPTTYIPLAGFFDRDGTGSYDPNSGDFPSLELRGCALNVYANEQLWFDFNDLANVSSGLPPLGLEVQTQVFAYNRPEPALLNNTVFVRYKIINLGQEQLDNCYVGLYADFDIGNPDDDYMGTIPDRSIMYGYNGDNEDEGGFGANIPIMAVEALRGPLDSFGIETAVSHLMVVDEIDGLTPVEAYNVLAGRFPNGSEAPDNGFLFPDNPNLSGGNSEPNIGNLPGKRAGVMSFGPIVLLPGSVNELIVAYYYLHTPGASPLQQVQELFDGANHAQALFDNCFNIDPVCSSSSPTHESRQDRHTAISPNPSTGKFLIESKGAGFTRLEMTDLLGRTIQTANLSAPVDLYEWNTEGLPNGVYLLLVDGQAEKVVLQR